MKGLKKYFLKLKNSGIVLIDQGLVSGTSFVTGILLTRCLGLEVYGQFVLLWMVILFGLSLTQALITKPLLSLQPKMPKEAATEYLGALHAMQCLTSLATTLPAALVLFALDEFGLLGNIGPQTILGLSIATGLILAYDFYRKCFFLKNDLLTPLVTDALLAFIQLGGIAILFFTDYLNITNLFLLISVNYLLVCIIGFLKIDKPVFVKEGLIKVFHKHYKFSKWLLGTVLTQWLCGNFFIICAGGILGTTVVGAVRIAQNVIGLTHVIFLAMENVVPISAARAFKDGGKKKLFHFLKSISLQIGWVVMAILILVSIFSPDILGLLYGAAYVEYAYILIGFCIIYLLVYVSYPLRFALRTLEMTKPIFIAYVLGACFSVIAAKPLLMYWGVYGLLVGLFATQLITQFVYIFSLWKIKKYYENHTLGTR